MEFVPPAVMVIAILMFLSALVYGSWLVIFLTGVYVTAVSAMVSFCAVDMQRCGVLIALAILIAGYVPAYFFYKWRGRRRVRASMWLKG